MSNCPICDAAGCPEALVMHYFSVLEIIKKPKNGSGGYKQRRLQRLAYSKRTKKMPNTIGIRKDIYEKLIEANNV